MSLFSDFTSGELINDVQYIRKKASDWKNLRAEHKTKKQLYAEMREKLSPEEYIKWLKKQNYEEKKESIALKYQANKKEKEEMLEDCWKLIDEIPEPKTIDEEFIERYKKDNVDGEGRYRYSWWASRLATIDVYKSQSILFPIKLATGINTNNLMAMQDKAYKAILPHIDKIEFNLPRISPTQKVTNRPMWQCGDIIREIHSSTSIPQHQLCEVALALIRDKYIINEAYMGEISFLCGDMICTSMGHMLLPSLENNLGRLNEDTVDYIHTNRLNYLKYKKYDNIPIAILRYAYLIKVPSAKIIEGGEINNYGHFDYYIVPTMGGGVNKGRDLNTILKKQYLIYKK